MGQIYSYIHAGQHKVTDVELRSFERGQGGDESSPADLIKVAKKTIHLFEE